MKIKTSLYSPRVKENGKYIYPHPAYEYALYSKKELEMLRGEIEEDYPKYKGKVVFFESVFEKTNL